jgi:diphthine-ammonia ligase
VKLAALYSGGKDSTMAAYIMEQGGHSVDRLVNIVPKDRYSWVFHTPNLHLMPLMAEAMGKELISVPSSGEEEDDLRALRRSLEGLDVDGVITGALASDYQWDRINGVCEDIGLRTFSPLWRKDQWMLLNEMVDAGIRAIIVGTYAEGLGEEWLGRELDGVSLMELKALADRYGMNVAGEGGEYETLTLDSPLHLVPLEVIGTEAMVERDCARLKVEGRLGRR